MIIDFKPPLWATHLLSDLDDWERKPRPISEITPIQLPEDAYFEYAWLHEDGSPRPDPDNSNPPCNDWWPHARCITGPDYRPDSWTDLEENQGPAGEVKRLRLVSDYLKQRRHIIVYTPAGYSGERLQQIVFQDGKAYYGWGKAPQIFDGLLKAGQCLPAHLIFIPPTDRSIEYHFNDTYMAFIVEELLPTLEEIAPCDGRRCAWGASMGGFCSAELAWRNPDAFQSIVSQSGAFLFHPEQKIEDDPYSGREWWAERVGQEAERSLRWHLQTGNLEWLHLPNRNLASALDESGYEVKYREYTSGNNWTTWRNGMADAFRFVLGQPD